MNEVHTVDARGLACPQPVLETKRAIEELSPTQLDVLVDNYTSCENVKRFALNKGLKVQVQEMGGEVFKVIIDKYETAASIPEQQELLPCPIPAKDAAPHRIAVYVGSSSMGKGDDELGTKLMRGFLRTWIDTNPKPWRMIFINSGVRLTTTDEEAVEALSLLSENGVEILSCGTCLQFFGLEDKLRIGKATNMYEVIESLNSATKVISPD
jgi:selenium metabolism protein YedF